MFCHRVGTMQGVYAILHRESGYRYIGSSLNIDSRWRGHIRKLERRQHHCRMLQTTWNVHGADAFELVVLELVDDPFALTSREQYWMDRTTALINSGRSYASSPLT